VRAVVGTRGRDQPAVHHLKDGAALHLQRTLTREKLEELTEDLVEKTVQILSQDARRGGHREGAIEDVILVGGMTRMPRVQAEVAKFFGMEPCKGVHPTRSWRWARRFRARAPADRLGDAVLDVTSHSLGIHDHRRLFHRLIQQNTTVPTTASTTFTTVKDNQTSV